MTEIQPNQSMALRRVHWKDLLIIGILIFLNCVIMLNASSVMDTARDVYYAWQIATAANFPLEGPRMAAAIHNGPIWFYILAIPLLFSKNWVVISLWVGLLSGLKYALAYACGSRLAGRNFGLIWACLLALPNWTSINYLIFTHINLVETTVLLCFYSFIRWQQNEKHWFLVMCFCVGLGIHAHPTVYAVGIAFLPIIAVSIYRKQLSWLYIVKGVLLVAILFLPFLISQYLQQWPDLHTSKTYLGSQSISHNLLGFIDVLRGTLIDGPIIALRYVLNLQGLFLWFSYTIIALIMAGGLGLALNSILRTGNKRPAVLLLASSLIIIAAVTLIRESTPYYMTLVIYPSAYGLIAWGWSQNNFPPRRLLESVFATMSIVFLLGFGMTTLAMGRSGHLLVSGKSMNNVQTHAVDEVTDSLFFPAWARNQLGAFICQQKKPVYFHGIASLLLEQSYALEAQMQCDTRSVYIGGKGKGQHLFGITQRDATQLGITTGPSTFGPLSLQETTQVIAPNHVEQLPKGDVYPPRQFFHSEDQSQTTEFTSSANELLAITNLYHYWMPFSFQVMLNGKQLKPLYGNGLTTYFACVQCSAEELQNWRVTITAPKPELVEIVTFIPNYEGQQS